MDLFSLSRIGARPCALTSLTSQPSQNHVWPKRVVALPLREAGAMRAGAGKAGKAGTGEAEKGTGTRRRQLTLVANAGRSGGETVLALSRTRPTVPPPTAPLRLPPADVFEYHVGFYEDEEARALYRALAALPHWAVHTLKIFDQERALNRLNATYAARPDRIARYSESSPAPEPLAAAPVVAAILAKVQAWAGPAYAINFVLLNYYRNGDDSVALHGDYLADMTGPVFSLSFQDTDDPMELRFFDIVENATGHKERIRAANGSLMVMHRAFHVLYKHGVPPQRGVAAGRINVTCRCVREYDHAPPVLRR